METLDQYLERLASDAPAPGGGSAATLVAAMGAALIAMVARISGRNPKYAAQRELAETIVRRADALRSRLLEAGPRDEAAFRDVVAAQMLPKANEPEKAARRSALEIALERAAAQPLRSAELAKDVLTLASEALEIPNSNLASDIGCAAEFASASINACAYNVRVNHRFMHDSETIAAQAAQLERYEREAQQLIAAIRLHPSTSSG